MENGYTSWKSSFWFGDGIPHYYGDKVRQYFIAAAVLSFIGMPLWGKLLPFLGTLPQVGAALLLVLLAGFTSPRNLLLMVANATVAGVSILLLESTAIIYEGLGTHPTELFLAREVAVLLLIGALYYSIKTVRAMMAGKLGQPDSPLEFNAAPSYPDESSEQKRHSNEVSEYDGD